MPEGGKPDYMLSVLNRVTDERSKVGAGWLNEDGSISIKLNLCVVLPADDDLVIRLFKNDYEERAARGEVPAPRPRKRRREGRPGPGDKWDGVENTDIPAGDIPY